MSPPPPFPEQSGSPSPLKDEKKGGKTSGAKRAAVSVGLGQITEEMSSLMKKPEQRGAQAGQQGSEVAYSGVSSGQFTGAQAVHGDSVGTFNGGSYRISHRDTNTILTVQLAVGCPVTAKPGVMVAMSHSVTVKGNFKFSVKKVLVGGEINHSTFTGPGEVIFAPHTLGDIHLLKLDGEASWSVGKDAFLASTAGVVKEYKSQSFSKAMFSGEGLFVYRISGVGILWMSSFGAIIRKDVSSN